MRIERSVIIAECGKILMRHVDQSGVIAYLPRCILRIIISPPIHVGSTRRSRSNRRGLPLFSGTHKQSLNSTTLFTTLLLDQSSQKSISKMSPKLTNFWCSRKLNVWIAMCYWFFFHLWSGLKKSWTIPKVKHFSLHCQSLTISMINFLIFCNFCILVSRVTEIQRKIHLYLLLQDIINYRTAVFSSDSK